MSDQKIPLEPPPAYDDHHTPDNVSASRHIKAKTAAPASGAEPKRANPPRGPFPLDIPVLNQLRGKRVILASASPRRKQLLAQVRHVGIFFMSVLAVVQRDAWVFTFQLRNFSIVVADWCCCTPAVSHARFCSHMKWCIQNMAFTFRPIAYAYLRTPRKISYSWLLDFSYCLSRFMALILGTP